MVICICYMYANLMNLKNKIVRGAGKRQMEGTMENQNGNNDTRKERKSQRQRGELSIY